MPADHVLIGKIVGAHGTHGNLKIVSFAESLEIFEAGSAAVLVDARGRRNSFVINWVKPHGRTALVSLEGIGSRDMAETLIGCEMHIHKARLPELEPGTYYWMELIGLDVVTTAGDYVGKIDSIIQTGSNDVYVVRDQQQEVLVPALEKVVVSVDLDKRQMRVDLPEGL